LKKKKTQPWFNYFQLPSSTKNILRLLRILFFTSSVYDY